MVKSDCNAMVAYTHPRLVELMGGKEVMIAMIKKMTKEQQAKGIGFESFSLKTPEEPKKIGKWLTAIITENIVLKVPEGTVNQESSLLGISEDEGKSWVFIDLLHTTPELLKKIIPDLADKIVIPPKKAPVLEKK